MGATTPALAMKNCKGKWKFGELTQFCLYIIDCTDVTEVEFIKQNDRSRSSTYGPRGHDCNWY